MKFLVMRLQAPLSAFGDTAIDETRPTDILPGAAQLTGLIGNALGWDHTDTDKLQRLQDRLRFAARADRPGILTRDYQTARVNSKDLMWRADGKVSEREGGSTGDFTIQRYKFYRADAAVTVLLALEPADETPAIEDIRRALKRPARPLFIGRAACPPSEPICFEPDGREIIEAETFEQALSAVGRRFFPGQSERKKECETRVVTEWPLTEIPADPAAAVNIFERRDLRRWSANTHGGRRLVWRDEATISAPRTAKEAEPHDS